MSKRSKKEKAQICTDLINHIIYDLYDENEECLRFATNALISSLVHVAALSENSEEILDQASCHIRESKTNGFLEEQRKFIREKVDE